MIIICLTGGLGNQMFQYAFGRANAIRLDAALALDLSNKSLQIYNGFELERLFNIQAKIASQADIHAVLGWQSRHITRRIIIKLGLKESLSPNCVEELNFHFAPEMLSISDNTYVSGYWQSEKYFVEAAKQIRSDFSFKLPLVDRNVEIVSQINQVNAVSLHIRRGDYASNASINAVHGLCGLDYYQAAIQYISDRVKHPALFIFSDDIDWVKRNLKTKIPCQYVDHNSGRESYNDMRLMSLCQHHIIANSSFSWWGAWLNPSANKIVVAPKRWFANETSVRDLIPEKWVML